MKGDFSRLTFDPRKRYTGVLMQQGRLLSDADWNEQALTIAQLGRAKFEDLVGPFAVPDGGGFQVCTAANGAPALSPGRIYAGGLTCELDAETPVGQVARKPLRPRSGHTDLVYLDAWERIVTELDDPELLDVALGGAEASVRVKAAWAIDSVEDVADRTCAGVAAALPMQGLGRMSAAAPGGYLGMENQLYRIEIHRGGGLGEATFKWSRRNGSVVVPIEQFVRDDSILVRPELQDSHTISVGNWLEIGGDEREHLGLPGTLARVEKWTPEKGEAVFDHDVVEHADEKRPRARRWDQSPGPIMSVEPGWVELEAGISVCFKGSDFRTGDYWTFPARPGSAAVEWPVEAPPQGIEHRFCPLALVTWHGTDPHVSATYDDCRPTFASLTEVCAELRDLRAEVAALAERMKASQNRGG
jgi:Family of unknown function (DUF6519)